MPSPPAAGSNAGFQPEAVAFHRQETDVSDSTEGISCASRGVKAGGGAGARSQLSRVRVVQTFRWYDLGDTRGCAFGGDALDVRERIREFSRSRAKHGGLRYGHAVGASLDLDTSLDGALHLRLAEVSRARIELGGRAPTPLRPPLRGRRGRRLHHLGALRCDPKTDFTRHARISKISVPSGVSGIPLVATKTTTRSSTSSQRNGRGVVFLARR